MIDFKNIVITKSFEYSGNEFFLRELSESDFERIQEESKKDDEKLMFGIWETMLCDKNGKQLKLSADDIKTIPMGLRKFMTECMLNLVTGEKKS